MEPRRRGSLETRAKEVDVEAWLDALSPDTRRIARALRNVVRRSAPRVEETLLWGGLSYHRPQIGGRVKGAVCQIGVKEGRVRLDFIHGIRLTDAVGVLRGDRLSKRFVPIGSVAAANRPEIVALILEAAALDPNAWS